MILNDAQIVATPGLVSPLTPSNVSNCAYILGAGKAYEPETGQELPIAGWYGRTHWSIGPSETLVIRTKERIKLPPDACAFYAPLQRLASEGLMLLNASIVEPGYDGPLSCFLLNFSSQTLAIFPGDPIAKASGRSRGQESRSRPVLAASRAPTAQLVQADASRLPLRASEFGWSLSARVLTHIPRPSELLEEVARVLEPDGRLLIVDIHAGHPYGLTTLDTEDGRVAVQTFKHSIDTVTSSLAVSGFEVDVTREFKARELTWLPDAPPFAKLRADPSIPVFYLCEAVKR